MPVDNTAIRNPSEDPINDPFKEFSSREGNLELPQIISNNPQTPKGRRNRQLLRWRVPGLGFVDMYMNPQQIRIQDKKIIQKARTKGGYIVQYWGEDLTVITIEGNTGAAGVEGINILRGVYRAEQNAFQQVAQTLADRLQSFTVGGSISSLVGAATGSALGDAAGNALVGLLGGSTNPPLLPTLGSLAVSAEMFYQGWVYKGYFDDFSVNESVANGVGLFTYSMTFYGLDRRGIRSNFMPWHRNPTVTDPVTRLPMSYNSSNADTTPLSFGGEE